MSHWCRRERHPAKIPSGHQKSPTLHVDTSQLSAVTRGTAQC